jgi:hypothetical protein
VALDTEYLVGWVDWPAIKAAAVAAGMPKDGEVLDYCDQGEFERGKTFKTFAAAVAFARFISPQDMWNCPRVDRRILVNDRDDLGNTFKTTHWETDAMWEVNANDRADPTEAEPHVNFDLAA